MARISDHAAGSASSFPSWRDDEIRFHHFRDKDGYEVDMVLERGAREVAGVEVKAGATVTIADFRGRIQRHHDGRTEADV